MGFWQLPLNKQILPQLHKLIWHTFTAKCNNDKKSVTMGGTIVSRRGVMNYTLSVDKASEKKQTDAGL